MHTTERTRLCRAIGKGLIGLVLTIGGVALLAPAAGAQTEAADQTPSTEAPSGREGQRRRFPHRPWLTEEQRACLEEQGVERPPEGRRPTEEQREAFRQAAEACGIEPPLRRWCRPRVAAPGDDPSPDAKGTSLKAV